MYRAKRVLTKWRRVFGEYGMRFGILFFRGLFLNKTPNHIQRNNALFLVVGSAWRMRFALLLFHVMSQAEIIALAPIFLEHPRTECKPTDKSQYSRDCERSSKQWPFPDAWRGCFRRVRRRGRTAANARNYEIDGGAKHKRRQDPDKRKHAEFNGPWSNIRMGGGRCAQQNDEDQGHGLALQTMCLFGVTNHRAQDRISTRTMQEKRAMNLVEAGFL